MGTKMKSNGDGSIKILAQDFGTATAAKKAKGKAEIVETNKNSEQPGCPTVEEFMQTSNFDGRSQADLDLIRAYASGGWFIEFFTGGNQQTWLAQVWNDKENVFSVRRSSKDFEKITAFAETEFHRANLETAEENLNQKSSGDNAGNIAPPEPEIDIENFRLWIDGLEVKGWRFDFVPSKFGNILAQKHFKYDEQPTKIEGYTLDEIERLLKRVDDHQSDMDKMGFGSRNDVGEPKKDAALYGIAPPKTAPETSAAKVAEEKSPVGGEINLSEIVPSPFEGQQRRRDRFTDEEISEMAASIKTHGVLQPIVVRAVGYEYEIIAGERRWLAAEKAELETIPAVVKNVSDEVAFEIQTIENLQRKDPDPIDEAFSYSEYIEKYGRTVDDLAVKFGKPVKFIRGRLRLTKLIPAVLEDVAKGFLPLGHAFEISKLAPENQPDALAFCYDEKWENGAYVPDKTEPHTLATLRSNIEDDIFLSLKSAKFGLKDVNLRDDGLPCVKCPERTGAAESLFAEMHDAKNDRCLNAFCFGHKTARFVQIKRETESRGAVARGEAMPGYLMPIIVWMPGQREKVAERFGETPLIDGEYNPITNNTGECEKMEYGIFVDDTGKLGEVIKICRAADCAKHKRRASSTSSGSSSASVPGEKTDEEKAKFYERKQELFDIKIGEAVRLKVLREAAESLSQDRWIFDGEKWRVRIVERLWSRTDDHAHRFVEAALGRKEYSISPGYAEENRAQYFAENFTPDELSRLLFLLIVANDAEMLWGNWKSHDSIRAVADEFGVDYALADAKERAVEAPKKFKEAAYEHLSKIERGEKAARPVFYKLEK